ncbi:MAG: hypothetical protein A2Y33_04865 [Spirochaetes bacterium GWF1_51_8]|nr:MAG: hypothetical protein A2Y33_04865 [Spirochaetes bacterium GWF1_51_8]
MKRAGLSIFILVALAARLSALVFTDRNYFYDPFQFKIPGAAGAFTHFWGWGEFGRYVYQSDLEHYWSAKLGGYCEVFRYGDTFSAVIGSDLELMSATNSDIYFEPRAIFWQEMLYFFYHYEGNTFGLGYHHRCKHDVDNMNIFIRTGKYVARVSIYDSITLRWNPDPIGIDWENGVFTWIEPYVKNHIYVIKSDLTTSNYTQPDMRITNILDTIELGAKIRVAEWEGISFYVHPAVFIDFYRKDKVLTAPVDWLFEGGFRFAGKLACLEVFFRYEHFYDAGIDYNRISGDYWLIGLKLE